MNKSDIVFTTLTSISPELKTQWDSYILEEYKDNSYLADRLDYVDISEISRFIVNKIKQKETREFKLFFEKVEELIANGDDDIKNLLIVGLLESIQNNCGSENIDYHNGFNEWLKPLTKKAWDYLIVFWEGNEKERIEIMKKNLFD